MMTHIERMACVYASHPVKVRYNVEVRRARTSRMVEHLREQQALREVNNALTQFYYGSRR